uniref:Transmembrane emp24 domain-containing protein 7 n=1 Tax=Capra hircus TaxID=9925 RepID=A0A8C2P2Q4_CAPHI
RLASFHVRISTPLPAAGASTSGSREPAPQAPPRLPRSLVPASGRRRPFPPVLCLPCFRSSGRSGLWARVPQYFPPYPGIRSAFRLSPGLGATRRCVLVAPPGSRPAAPRRVRADLTPRLPSSVEAAASGCPGGASEITFELPDNAKQCFYEDITQGTKCTLEFQVITGGHYDVDCRLEDPDGNVLYKEMKKQYDSYTFTASKNGTYKFCFSNEFSTFTHKTVYFDFQVGEDPPLFPSENRVSALTQMESACVSIHEALKSVIDYQTHFRLREAQGRSRAEDLNTRVAYWSVGEALILLVVSIGQVFLLKSFFSDKRTTTTRVGS